MEYVVITQVGSTLCYWTGRTARNRWTLHKRVHRVSNLPERAKVYRTWRDACRACQVLNRGSKGSLFGYCTKDEAAELAKGGQHASL